MVLCAQAGTRKVTHGTHLANSGAMRTGWYKEGSTWYYLKDSGAMAQDGRLQMVMVLL